MNAFKKYSIVAIMVVMIGACDKYNLPVTPKPKAGDADFTKTVAVGSSLTAGFMNGALYTQGQSNSFMSIMAKQMALVGGGEFNQPDINAVNGDYGITAGLPAGVAGRLYLKLPTIAPPNPACTTSGPGPSPKLPGNTITAYAGDKSKLNNFSVYKASIQLSLTPALSGPAAGNPYFNPWFSRFAASPSVNGATGSSLVGDAAAALANNGTFFVFWLGIDDVLGFALNGAVLNDPAAPLTTTPVFSGTYTVALNTMLNAKATAKGVVGNIPDVSSLPYFTTVKWNSIVFLSCNPVSVGTVNLLNSAGVYGGYNQALDAIAAGLVPGVSAEVRASAQSRKVVFKTGTTSTTGANGIVIKDQTLFDLGPYLSAINPGLSIFGQVRQANSTDLITLAAGSVLPTGVGVSPAAGFLGDKYVLVPSEVTFIQASITAFNSAISAAVTANPDRLALFDANAVLKEVAGGTIAINGSALTSSISPPAGAFSLDGVHPNARGQAYIANKIIGVINAKWNSTIPLCNPNDFAPNDLPAQ